MRGSIHNVLLAIDTIQPGTYSGVKTHNVSFDRPWRTTLVDDKLHRLKPVAIS